VNTWEFIYDVPKVTEDQMMLMILNPNGTKSDSFYFADNELVIHKKAEYDYCTLMM
jgi:hypothetical protein